MIGDPGGKNSERSFLDEETLANNVKKIEDQVNTILKNITDISGETFEFEVKNNLDFFQRMDYL
jgi:tyrosyl-tRNA synthetase